MRRLESVLQLVLIVAVLAVGVVVWRADQRARDADDRLACMAKIDTTASIALLAPSRAVDEQGRLDAIKTLGDRLDRC